MKTSFATLRRAAATLALAGLALPLFAQSKAQPKADAKHAQASAKDKAGAWLFAGFKRDSKDGVYFVTSLDGYHWHLVNSGRAVVPPTSPGELMRDPFIQRAPDGGFRMVWTWAWYDPHVIGYSESRDLVRWSPHRQIAVMSEPGAANVWAPALYYDAEQKRWLIFWASTIPGKFSGDDSGDFATSPGGKIGLNHRIWSTTTTDFNTFTPAKLFFDPGYSVIDATLLPPQSPKAPFTLILRRGPRLKARGRISRNPSPSRGARVRRSFLLRLLQISQRTTWLTTITTRRASTMGRSSRLILSTGATRSAGSTSLPA